MRQKNTAGTKKNVRISINVHSKEETFELLLRKDGLLTLCGYTKIK